MLLARLPFLTMLDTRKSSRHEVVRHHNVPRCFYSVGFTLATHLQMLPTKTVPGFLTVVRAFLFTAYSAGKEFQALLGLAEKTRVGFFFAFRISVERLKPHIQADRFTRRLASATGRDESDWSDRAQGHTFL